MEILSLFSPQYKIRDIKSFDLGNLNHQLTHPPSHPEIQHIKSVLADNDTHSIFAKH